MSKVFFDTGISLDGFMAGDNRGPQNPLGDGGPTIHHWAFQQKAFWRILGTEGGKEEGPDGKLISDTFSRTGCYIMGKRMFEEGEVNWPEDLYKAPVYVLTHTPREPWIQRGRTAFHFVTDGIESALSCARKTSDGRDIRIQGGAGTIQQFLNAGLVDDFTIHIAPVFLGSGIRLFENIDKHRFNVEIIETVQSPLATHVRYRIKRKREQP